MFAHPAGVKFGGLLAQGVKMRFRRQKGAAYGVTYAMKQFGTIISAQKVGYFRVVFKCIAFIIFIKPKGLRLNLNNIYQRRMQCKKILEPLEVNQAYAKFVQVFQSN